MNAEDPPPGVGPPGSRPSGALCEALCRPVGSTLVPLLSHPSLSGSLARGAHVALPAMLRSEASPVAAAIACSRLLRAWARTDAGACRAWRA